MDRLSSDRGLSQSPFELVTRGVRTSCLQTTGGTVSTSH
jgi:hypothetical protein